MKSKIKNRITYDLEDRTYNFAVDCREFVKLLPQSMPNFEYSKQLIRASGSQAANYIEANESLGKKDFLMRIRICRKEAKESKLWLKLSDIQKEENLNKRKKILIQESIELTRIFGSILEKCK